MEIFDSIVELQGHLDSRRLEGKRIGLVPTMGALHDGHVQLVNESIATCDITVCSIFVNPTQFNNAEDLSKYPKQIEEDQQMLRTTGCNVVFTPTIEEMYPSGEETLSIHFGVLENVLEGAFRPGHFSGVGVVVSKLLNIVQPDFAFFGQKDLQQLAIIRKLAKNLNIRTSIRSVPTVRESSGLAMSSRNLRLSKDDKEMAAHLYQSMETLKNQVLSGISLAEAISFSKAKLGKLSKVKLEYLEVVNSDSMAVIDEINNTANVSVCIAAYVGDVRLIDNLYIKQEV